MSSAGTASVSDPVHPRPSHRHRHDPVQDLLILVIVVMCSILAIKLVVEFVAWNKLQTCISAGRNCAPRSAVL